MEKPEKRSIRFRVLRFAPDGGGEPGVKEYLLDVAKGTTVLDALIQLKEEQDNTLSFRYSCRMGVCGSCGMFINGLPRLGCQTQVFELASDVVEVRPLPNFGLVRDLAVDFDTLFERHRCVKPHILRRDGKELEHPTGEYVQTQENLDWIYQFTYCVMCGACLSACPTACSDPRFLGPQALAQAYRYVMDMRDEGFAERLGVLDTAHGAWRCHFATSCSQVCPKGVDPALGVQLLKREILLRRLRARRDRAGAGLAPAAKDAKRLDGIPEAPPKSV